MTFKIIFFAAFTPFVLAQLGQKCVPSRNLEAPNFIEYPTNCSKFLICDNEVYVDMDCPARLHFNPVKKICDWPAMAGCRGNTIAHQDPEIKENNIEAVLGQRCRLSENRNTPKVAAYPGSCQQFLICASVWTLMNCPTGLLFSIETGHCEFPEHAKCCPTCLSNTQKCSKHGTRLSNPTDCRKFYFCQNDILIDSVCTDGMIFSAFKGECVNGTSCTSLLLPSTENLPSCPIEGTLYPNYENCKKFFICNGGTIVEQSCPPNKFFSIKHNNCQFQFNSVCASDLKLIKDEEKRSPA